MEHLFAPWRMEYIGSKRPEGCLFCRVLEAPSTEDETNLVVWRPPGGVVILNRFPYNNGHLMVAPAAHVGSLTDLDDEQSLQLMRALRRSLSVLESALGPEGFNAGVNLGKVAGAEIPDHVHVHVVPRWDGDTNFMPVLGATKVIGQHLASSWEQLRAAFDS